MNKIEQTLLSIRDIIIEYKPEYRYIFTNNVVRIISDGLLSLKYSHTSVKRIVANLLKRISFKLKHKQRIDTEVSLLNKFSDAVTKSIAVSSKLIIPSTLIQLIIRTTRINIPRNTRLGKALLVWSLFVKLLYAIQLIGLTLTIRDSRQLSSNFAELADELVS